MSTVIQFPSRAAAPLRPGGYAGQSAGVIPLAERRQQRLAQVVAASEVRTLRWVSPLEAGLLQARFSGSAVAAEYLLSRADIKTSALPRKRDDWQLLWVSEAEVDFFSHMGKAGLRAAANLLLKRADEDAQQNERARKALALALKRLRPKQ